MFSESAAVMIVLHNRLSIPEAQEVQNLVTTFKNRYPARRIVVVYFPANEVDASVQAVNRMKQAFQIAPSGPTRPSDNLMFMFAPTSGSGGGNWDNRFRNYWLALATRTRINLATSTAETVAPCAGLPPAQCL